MDITKEDVKNSKLSFLLNIKYQFLHSEEEISAIGLQILNRIFHDIVSKKKFKTVSEVLNFFKRLTESDSVNFFNALNIVYNFDETNYKDKTIILICLINLFNNNPYKKTISEISYYIYDNKKISFDIYKIAESVFLICASMFYT